MLKDRGGKNIAAHWAFSSMKTWCLHPACRAKHEYWFWGTGNKFPGGPSPHHVHLCAPLWGGWKAEVRPTLPHTPGRTASSAWSLLNIRGVQSVLHLYLCTFTLEHLLPKGFAPWQWGSAAPFPLQHTRQPTKRSCFFVFPQPCVALQKLFLAIFPHRAGLGELWDHKQFASSVLRTCPNTLAFQPLQWRTSQPPPSSIYSHNSKILAPLPTFSSLKLSESRDHIGEPAASVALPASIGVRCGKQAVTNPHPFPCTHTLTF